MNTKVKKSRLHGIREVKSKLSEMISDAKGEPVIITNRGKPEAILFNINGMDMQDVILFTSKEFRKALNYDKKKGTPIEKLMEKYK